MVFAHSHSLQDVSLSARHDSPSPYHKATPVPFLCDEAEAAGLENLLESGHVPNILRDFPTFMQNAWEITG
jgi:hypothetical protein